jgi:hypothetical protein
MAIHANLADGGWQKLTLMEQLGNIGSELSRAFKWKEKGEDSYVQHAFYRALELIDLTVADPRWRYRLKELLRLREALCEYFYGDNRYRIDPKMVNKEFLYYAYAARRHL